MPHGRRANTDTHAGTTHTRGCTHSCTTQHLPALIDTYTNAYWAKACAHTSAEATATQPNAYGKRSNRNTHANACPHGAVTG